MNRFMAEDHSDDSSSSDTDSEDVQLSSLDGRAGLPLRRSHSDPLDQRLFSTPPPIPPPSPFLAPYAAPHNVPASPTSHINAMTDDIGGKILAGQWPLKHTDSVDSLGNILQDEMYIGNSPQAVSPSEIIFHDNGLCTADMKCVRCNRDVKGSPGFLQRQPHTDQLSVMCQECYKIASPESPSELHPYPTPPNQPVTPPLESQAQSRTQISSPLRRHIEEERRRLLGMRSH